MTQASCPASSRVLRGRISPQQPVAAIATICALSWLGGRRDGAPAHKTARAADRRPKPISNVTDDIACKTLPCNSAQMGLLAQYGQTGSVRGGDAGSDPDPWRRKPFTLEASSPRLREGLSESSGNAAGLAAWQTAPGRGPSPDQEASPPSCVDLDRC